MEPEFFRGKHCLNKSKDEKSEVEEFNGVKAFSEMSYVC
jgi:hypothetical protein